MNNIPLDPADTTPEQEQAYIDAEEKVKQEDIRRKANQQAEHAERWDFFS